MSETQVFYIQQIYTLSEGQEIPFKWYSPTRVEDLNRFKKNIDNLFDTFFKLNGEHFWTNIIKNEEWKLKKLAETLKMPNHQMLTNDDLVTKLHLCIGMNLSGMRDYEVFLLNKIM